MSQGPNLIYVFADQLRLQSCGYAGDELATTPTMDRLATEACDLRQFVASTPVCAAYRASLMTGKYQSGTGMVINELRLSPEHETFGNVLTAAGYDTAYIGKWHLWANELGNHDATRNGFVPPGPYRLGFDGLWAGYNFNHGCYDAPYFRDEPSREFWKGYEPDSQTTMAIDYLKGAAVGDRPFAMFLSWGPPHSPWTLDNCPPEHRERYAGVDLPLRGNYTETIDRYCDAWQRPNAAFFAELPDALRGYYAQVANLDDNLARLLATVDELGIAGDTIFVFTSDHGEMFGSHGRRGKLTFYEESCRVPFLLRWPGHVPTGKNEALLTTPDLMPTLLSLMKLPCPDGVEGVDASAALLGESDGPEFAMLQGMGATAAWDDGSEWRSVRNRDFTYAIYHADGRELLFNHRIDPLQLRDLSTDAGHGATLSHLRSQLQGWMREHNDEFHACSWYEHRWTRDRNITATALGGPGQDLDQLRDILKQHNLAT